MKKTYALYYGDTFIDLGSRKYIADLLGVTEKRLNGIRIPLGEDVIRTKTKESSL